MWENMDNINSENITGLSDVKFQDVDSSSHEKINRAYEMYTAGRYKEALAVCEADSQISNTAYGQVLIGNCYKQLGDKISAMSHWRKAIEISPLEPSSYINIANHLYSTGNVNEAILNWHIAGSIMPENPTISLNLANAYNKKGSRIKSTKYFEKYLRYEKNINAPSYIKTKQVFANLTAKVDFFAKTVEEYKLQKDLKTIAALYLKMISTYANLPNIYANIAEIFYFDKNYEKSLEFYLLVYIYFSHTPKVLLEIANLYYILKQNSYAYVYYHRAVKNLPEGTSYFNKVKSKLSSLSSVLRDPELIETHLQKAREAESNNEYELAIDEYENFLILSESEDGGIQQIIDRYKIFVNPEPFVISVLYNQIPDLMNRKKLNTCVELCDRIMTMSTQNSKEVVYAMKCKADCKRIIIAREQFGV